MSRWSKILGFLPHLSCWRFIRIVSQQEIYSIGTVEPASTSATPNAMTCNGFFMLRSLAAVWTVRGCYFFSVTGGCEEAIARWCWLFFLLHHCWTLLVMVHHVLIWELNAARRGWMLSRVKLIFLWCGGRIGCRCHGRVRLFCVHCRRIVTWGGHHPQLPWMLLHQVLSGLYAFATIHAQHHVASLQDWPTCYKIIVMVGLICQAWNAPLLAALLVRAARRVVSVAISVILLML